MFKNKFRAIERCKRRKSVEVLTLDGCVSRVFLEMCGIIILILD